MRTKLTAALVVLGIASLWSVAQEGCSSSSTKPPPPATGSGAFGVVTVGGKQGSLPLQEPTLEGHGQIAVVDVGITGTPDTCVTPDGGYVCISADAGTPALITNIDLGDAGVATATAGDSTVVIAAGTNTHAVWFIDPTTNKITDIIHLDPSLSGASFSGGGGAVNGIAIDEANHRAILSVWNGVIFLDLGSHKVTGSTLAAGAENIGYDSSLQYVLSPYYDCGEGESSGNPDGGGATPPPCNSYVSLGDAGTVITDGLNLIDIKNNKVYTFENPDGGASAPVGYLPDSAAVDTTTGLAMVASEGSGFYSFLDLSKATLGAIGDAGIFTAPLILKVPYSPSHPFEADDGVAVEPTSHLAFCEQEFSDHISVVDLTKLSGGSIIGDGGVGDGGSNTDPLGFAPGAFADGHVPGLPNGLGWSNLGDPHGIAVTTGIQTGGPVGFVVTDQGGAGVWVARIDLNKMLAIGADAGATLEGSALAPAITFLDALTKE